MLAKDLWFYNTHVSKLSYVLPNSFDYNNSIEFNNQTAFVTAAIQMFLLQISPRIIACCEITQDSDYVIKLPQEEFGQTINTGPQLQKVTTMPTVPLWKFNLVHFLWLDFAVQEFIVCSYLTGFLEAFAFGLGSFWFYFSFFLLSLAPTDIKTWAVIFILKALKISII